MLFNSLDFLIFFPIVTLLYFIIPRKVRYLFLLAASYYFYMCWNPRYALLMLLSTAITYFSGLLISRANRIPDPRARERQKKLWVWLSFGSNLAILCVFKYLTFFLENLTRVLGLAGVAFQAPAIDLLLPVGISFYTFQALGYTMDVYRGDIDAEPNFFRYALFVSFFPQLVAGPIERSGSLLRQLREYQRFDGLQARAGLVRMGWGLFQKMVIADRLAILVDTVYNNPAGQPGSAVALATVLFCFQIYCDFGGYSNIAIGAAQVMGVRLMDNFRQPFLARSIQDFWRRWHISLSTWFRDFLYFPLGGSRKGTGRAIANNMAGQRPVARGGVALHPLGRPPRPLPGGGPPDPARPQADPRGAGHLRGESHLPPGCLGVYLLPGGLCLPPVPGQLHVRRGAPHPRPASGLPAGGAAGRGAL